jgi:hypothetical protein
MGKGMALSAGYRLQESMQSLHEKRICFHLWGGEFSRAVENLKNRTLHVLILSILMMMIMTRTELAMHDNNNDLPRKFKNSSWHVLSILIIMIVVIMTMMMMAELVMMEIMFFKIIIMPLMMVLDSNDNNYRNDYK